jgi:hypothetical protein
MRPVRYQGEHQITNTKDKEPLIQRNPIRFEHASTILCLYMLIIKVTERVNQKKSKKNTHTMTKRKRTTRQTRIYKTLHRKLKQMSKPTPSKIIFQLYFLDSQECNMQIKNY